MQELVANLAIPDSQITWIAHYGRFSEARSYENLHTPDSFYQINRWEVKEGEKNDEEETYLLKEQVSELMGGQQLEPVEQVLKELDAADLSDWSQVDVEKALAESRQRWERANSPNAAN
jgi:hypothetical protein